MGHTNGIMSSVSEDIMNLPCNIICRLTKIISNNIRFYFFLTQNATIIVIFNCVYHNYTKDGNKNQNIPTCIIIFKIFYYTYIITIVNNLNLNKIDFI